MRKRKRGTLERKTNKTTKNKETKQNFRIESLAPRICDVCGINDTTRESKEMGEADWMEMNHTGIAGGGHAIGQGDRRRRYERSEGEWGSRLLPVSLSPAVTLWQLLLDGRLLLWLGHLLLVVRHHRIAIGHGHGHSHRQWHGLRVEVWMVLDHRRRRRTAARTSLTSASGASAAAVVAARALRMGGGELALVATSPSTSSTVMTGIVTASLAARWLLLRLELVARGARRWGGVLLVRRLLAELAGRDHRWIALVKVVVVSLRLLRGEVARERRAHHERSARGSRRAIELLVREMARSDPLRRCHLHRSVGGGQCGVDPVRRHLLGSRGHVLEDSLLLRRLLGLLVRRPVVLRILLWVGANRRGHTRGNYVDLSALCHLHRHRDLGIGHGARAVVAIAIAIAITGGVRVHGGGVLWRDRHWQLVHLLIHDLLHRRMLLLVLVLLVLLGTMAFLLV